MLFELLKLDRWRRRRPDFYAENFKDSSFNNWKIGTSSSERLITPNKVDVVFNFDEPEFSRHDIISNVSTKMWMWSLGFILHVDKKESVLKILDSFEKDDLIRKDLYSISSWDHCTSVRINSMLCLQQKWMKGPVYSSAESIIEKDAAEIKPDRLFYNNHGMMLAFAGLHIVALKKLSKNERNRLFDVCSTFISEFISKTFDEQGWCNENTPGYQDFFRKYLLNATKFAIAFQLNENFCNRLIAVQKKVDEALRKVVLPNGNIPPIGESGAYPTKFSSIEGRHFFKDSGFYVNKNKETFLSIISGARSETHKQMDDTSICIWSKGSYLLVDSGLYNYDVHDLRSHCINSQRGHSGFYFRRFDEYRRPHFKKSYPSYLAKIDVNGDGKFDHVVCECAIPTEGLRWYRKVYVENLKRIIIEDTACGGLDLVQRFVVPLSADIRVDLEKSTVEIRNGQAGMTMLFDDNIHAKVRQGEMSPDVCGWRSTGFGQIEESQVLEINPMRNNSRIDIKIF